MNKDCSAVRDLMPLCIDGAASEVSRELVVKHVWECEECAAVYAQMQGELQGAPREEQAYLDETARRLRRRRKNRRRILVALTALLTAIAVVAGILGWQYAVHSSQIPLGLDEYDAVLTRTEDGNVLLNLYAHDRRLSYGVTSEWKLEEDGCYVVTLTPHTTLIREYHDQPVIGMCDEDFANAHWVDGLVYADQSPGNTGEAPHQICCIRVVSRTEERIVYQAGDDLPFCSPEMAEFYRIEEEIEILSHNERVDQLLDDMIRQRQSVPEWN